jgi:hypothetical protein
MNFTSDDIDLSKRGKMFNNIYNYDYSDVQSARKRRLSNLITSINMGMKLHNLSSNEILLLYDEYGDNWREKLGVEDSRVQKIMNDIRDGLMFKDLNQEEIQTLRDWYGDKWKEKVGYVNTQPSISPSTKYVSYADCLKHGKSP